MNKMGRLGSSADMRSRGSRFSQNAGLTSVRFATVLGGLCAFVLLCMFSLQASARPLADGTTHVLHADNSLPAVVLAARDPVAQVGRPTHDTRSRGETAASAPFALASSDRRYVRGRPATGARDTEVDRQMWLLALAAPAVVALAGACLSRAALRRATQKWRRAEDGWTRRCDAAEAQERAARVEASVQARAAAKQERLWLLGAMRLYTEAPLTALAGLVESLGTAAIPSAQRTQALMIQSAVHTWAQTLHDLLDISPLESRALVLDESATNPREVIDGVIALLAPTAGQRGLRPTVSVDQTVATLILADSARLGQILFHLLNRTIQHSTQGQIAVVVQADRLNAGSQRISVKLMETGREVVHHAQVPLFGPGASPALGGEWAAHLDACLALCQILAQRMQGELSVSNDSESAIRASFSAPFSVEQWGSSAELTSNAQAPLFASAASSQVIAASTSSEPFERRYLDALSEEGINLHTFLSAWRRSMTDDLARLNGLHHQRDIDELHTLLHRLSGAVGLVGARSLTEALRRASTAPDLETSAIDSLIERGRTLVTQLDTAIDPHWSTIR
jgi:signal transduction histidine kinase